MAPAPKGLDRLLRQVAGLSDAAAKAMSDEMGEQAYLLADAIENAAPKKTGRLAMSVDYCAGDPPEGAKSFSTGRASRSIDLKAAYSQQGILYSVFAGSKDAYWADWVEFGTRAGVKGSKATTKSGTRTVKRTHPGTAAQPFFYPTVRARIPVIQRRLRTAASKATKAVTQIT